MTTQIEFGCEYRDTITGFKGKATGQSSYISGCSRVLLEAKAEKDKVGVSEWFDLQRLEPVKSKPVKIDNSRTPGPGREAPKH